MTDHTRAAALLDRHAARTAGADQCPQCNSPQPHLHPAVQFEGEVETCPHEFHLQVTPQNTASYRELVAAKRHLPSLPVGGAEGDTQPDA